MTECPHSSVYLNGEDHQQQWKGVLPLLADQVTADGKLYCSLRAFYLQSSYIHYIAAVLSTLITLPCGQRQWFGKAMLQKKQHR